MFRSGNINLQDQRLLQDTGRSFSTPDPPFTLIHRGKQKTTTICEARVKNVTHGQRRWRLRHTGERKHGIASHVSLWPHVLSQELISSAIPSLTPLLHSSREQIFPHIIHSGGHPLLQVLTFSSGLHTDIRSDYPLSPRLDVRGSSPRVRPGTLRFMRRSFFVLGLRMSRMGTLKLFRAHALTKRKHERETRDESRQKSVLLDVHPSLEGKKVSIRSGVRLELTGREVLRLLRNLKD